MAAAGEDVSRQCQEGPTNTCQLRGGTCTHLSAAERDLHTPVAAWRDLHTPADCIQGPAAAPVRHGEGPPAAPAHCRVMLSTMPSTLSFPLALTTAPSGPRVASWASAAAPSTLNDACIKGFILRNFSHKWGLASPKSTGQARVPGVQRHNFFSRRLRCCSWGPSARCTGSPTLPGPVSIPESHGLQVSATSTKHLHRG